MVLIEASALYRTMGEKKNSDVKKLLNAYLLTLQT